ncbi:MAG: right-handed parallel beta-helix repeat-containing protein, partial [Blautia sp.]|nr:right-handed parallel beta-helix repeat-containing protein [Blautia sp.]
MFKSGSLILGSNTELHIESGAVLKGSDDINDYARFADLDTRRDVPSYVNCEYAGKPANYFLFAAGAENLRITGFGTIDGSEEIYYGEETPYFIDGAWYPRTPLLFLENIKHLTVKDVTLTRSGFWTLHMVGCTDVLVDGIRILNNLRLANCDGIDPDHCKDVRITNCHIECADDCIVLKTSGAYKAYGPTENILIRGCTLTST